MPDVAYGVVQRAGARLIRPTQEHQNDDACLYDEVPKVWQHGNKTEARRSVQVRKLWLEAVEKPDIGSQKRTPSIRRDAPLQPQSGNPKSSLTGIRPGTSVPPGFQLVTLQH